MKCEKCGKLIVFYRITYLCEDGHDTSEVVEPANKPSPSQPPPPTTGTSFHIPPSGRKMLMPFGKHRGTPVAALPADYIMWLLENLADIREDLRIELQNQLDLKSGKGVVRSTDG